MKKNFAFFKDEMGFIGHIDSNGELEFGDGAQRFGMKYLFDYILQPAGFEKTETAFNFIARYRLLFDIDNEPRRHWDDKRWWGKKGTMSGDQIIPLICCMLIMRQHKELKNLFLMLLKRGFFAWNTKKIGQQDEKTKIPDFVFFRVFGLLLRFLCTLHMGLFFLYPIVFMWDLVYMSIETLVRIIKPLFDRDDVGDDLNFFCSQLTQNKVCPTPASWFLFNMYLVLRPYSGDKEFRDKYKGTFGVLSAFAWYFRSNLAPPFDDLLGEVLIND